MHRALPCYCVLHPVGTIHVAWSREDHVVVTSWNVSLASSLVLTLLQEEESQEVTKISPFQVGS